MDSYKDLVAWQKAMLLAKETYKLIRCLPKEENYAIADQMRRSVISVPSNIAEGFGRHSTKEYIHFLNISRGSLNELETQALICIELEYFSKDKAAQVLELCNECSRLLTALVGSLNRKIT